MELIPNYGRQGQSYFTDESDVGHPRVANYAHEISYAHTDPHKLICEIDAQTLILDFQHDFVHDTKNRNFENSQFFSKLFYTHAFRVRHFADPE